MKKILLLLTLISLFNSGKSQYCLNGGPTDDEDSNVESVEIIGENNTLINYIGCPAVLGVENQTSLYVNLNSGSSYTLDVQFGTCDDDYASVGEAWIDWNQDEIFDTSESIGTWSGTPPDSMSNFLFTVPSNAVNGNTRMRVIQYEAGALPIDPCATFQWGSVVDFSININVTCPAPQNLSVTNISNSSANLSWTAGGNETAWSIEYGPSGFTQSNGSTVSSVSSNPYNLSGLSAGTYYDFYVMAICSANDQSSWSGPFSFGTTCGNISAPYFENFDFSFPICWVQDTTDEFDWTLNNGGTNSANTGPSDDISRGGNYIYTEASNPRDSGDKAVVYSGLIDVSNLTNPELNFYYHMYGSAIGDLEIDLYNGNNYVNIFTLSGDQGNQWIQERIPFGIGGLSLTTIKFRITGTLSVNTDGDTWPGDISIDNFEVRESPTCPEVLIQSLNANNITSSSAELSWLAGGNETAWNIEYGNFGFVQGAGTTLSVTSSNYNISGLNPTSTYSFYVQSFCSTNDLSFWTGPYDFTTSCPARIAPFTENFDTLFPTCWTQEDVLDDFDWTLNSGPPPSLQNGFQTGPSDDVTGGGSYMYTEASNPRDDGDFAIMYSENIDLTNLTNPMLQFYTHMYGSAIGEIQIDVFDGNNYIPIFNKVGEQGDFWKEENILIDPSLNFTQFRITGILSIDSAGDTWPGDIAIDEFRVFEATVSDLELYKGYSNSGCSLSSSEQVSILIVNKGINPQSNFNVSYKINGGAQVSEIVASTVNFEDTLNYSFNTPADLSLDGVYNFEFETQLINDQVPSNNIFNKDEENFTSPTAALTVNDTICKGEPLSLQAISNQGLINWYSDAAGMMPLNGNIVIPPPTTTTTYYAEVQGSEFYKADFESYNFGDFIAQSSSEWTTISGNGGIQDQDDARISISQSYSGINSVYLNQINNDNLFLLFNQDVNEGLVEISVNLKLETSANINFQNSTTPGSTEIFELRMNSGTLEFDIGTNVLTGSYPGNNTWFNLKIVGDLNSLFWAIYIDGIQISGANIPGANQIGLVNFTTIPGDAYYIDDVEWYVISDDDCYSSLTALTVFVEPCLSVSEKINSDIQLFPNPTSGIINFIASSEIKNIEIIDFQGKLVLKKNMNSFNSSINLREFGRGIYLIKIITSSAIIHEKVILN